MNVTKKKAVLIECILKGDVLPAERFFIQMNKCISEAARQFRLASPSGIHWMVCLSTLTYLVKV